MYEIYIDSGTSNSKLFLLKDRNVIDTFVTNVGTKDSAISGSNDVLLVALKKMYDTVLARNQVVDTEVTSICLSGMVTNFFGIVEVPHISTPIGVKTLWDKRHIHFENKYFGRDLILICGAKTAQPKELVTMENIDKMNNVRGEEIEAMGMIAKGVFKEDEGGVMISPGSHTHMLYIKNEEIKDIVSSFTGELTHAIKSQTILGGELSDDDVKLDQGVVIKGYEMIKEYGLARALYIVHATKVFDVCKNEDRNALLLGMIVGGVIDMLKYKIENQWKDVKKIVIIGGKNYIESYKILGDYVLPNQEIDMIKVQGNESYALYGYCAMTQK